MWHSSHLNYTDKTGLLWNNLHQHIASKFEQVTSNIEVLWFFFYLKHFCDFVCFDLFLVAFVL